LRGAEAQGLGGLLPLSDYAIYSVRNGWVDFRL
jgi:hypothetical protein